MAIISIIVGIVAVVGGLWASYQFDTPTGPSIVVAAIVVYSVVLLVSPHKIGRSIIKRR